MKNEVHKLLKKQLKEDLGTEHIPENLKKFIQSVNMSYFEFGEELELMERSIEVSSHEYNEKTTELIKAEERLKNIIETIPQGIIIVESTGKIIFVNSAAERLFGLARDELIGMPYWQMRTAEGLLPSAEDLAWDLALRTGKPIAGMEYTIEGFDGVERILHVNAAPLHNTWGNITGIVASLEDITLRKEMEERLRYLSLHDSLTGLYNRAYFEEEMRRLGFGRSNPVGIVICDIDGLKLVNDTLGHEQGDRLLELAANIIKGCFRKSDTVARIGGDEFAILLPKSSKAVVENACHRLQKSVEEHNSLWAAALPFGISIGFAISDEQTVNMTDLFKEADNNMYREKLHHHQSTRSAIVQTLAKAMGARDFCTEGHADRMQDLVERLAEAVGLSARKKADLRLLAQFHDIGKVGIPDRILFKPGPLTQEEFIEMQRHCEIGHRIAQSAPELVLIADWILKHHESWNGNGYPMGLKGQEIPLECRMLAIVDAYDAMTSDRPYRKALNPDDAAAELRLCSGTQFDPDLIDKFLQLLGKE